MKVAWVTHRDYDARGGAEIADAEMLKRRPQGVEVMLVRPGGVGEDLADFDRVVISGLLGLSSREQNILAKLKPVIWVHDMATTGHWLYEKADPLICLTPTHFDWECETTPALERREHVEIPGWLDTTVFHPETPKIEAAMWAAAPYDHKGLDSAVQWADQQGLTLTVITGRPHRDVVMAMNSHKFFVLLAKIRDPGPRTAIEAALAGCVLVTNENVGVWPEEREDLKARIDRCDKDFWGIVCGS